MSGPRAKSRCRKSRGYGGSFGNVVGTSSPKTSPKTWASKVRETTKAMWGNVTKFVSI